MKSKSELRQHYRQRRLQIPASQRRRKSQSIVRLLSQTVDWSKISSLHIYDSRLDWGEVETKPLIDYLVVNYPAIKIDIARQSFDDDLPRASYDLIIIPVLAYDDAKHRLGMGKGWYDRFLANQPTARKIGLAYTESFVDQLPVEPHDQTLDIIYSA